MSSPGSISLFLPPLSLRLHVTQCLDFISTERPPWERKAENYIIISIVWVKVASDLCTSRIPPPIFSLSSSSLRVQLEQRL
ncbi:hypothetical protein GBAR_LOCUS26749 [Geodia barretti]|uniref:Uncharacterized protein n=1 Tax=Geodia barretti TaxID=519541 RepID=A0AA35X7P7_GEOBA|nr:hypothetical protein GBAR_LOCUS26749 [Geodia barretti]